MRLDLVPGNCRDLNAFVATTGVTDENGTSYPTFWGVTTFTLLANGLLLTEVDFETVEHKIERLPGRPHCFRVTEIDLTFQAVTEVTRIDWKPSSPACEDMWRTRVAFIEAHEQKHVDIVTKAVASANQAWAKKSFKACRASDQKAIKAIANSIARSIINVNQRLKKQISKGFADLDARESAGPLDCCPVVVYDTPGAYQWRVPNGVTSIVVDVYGAEGGGNFTSFPDDSSIPGTTPGGKGAHVTATLAVSPGQWLELEVGGKGLYAVNRSAVGWRADGFGAALGLGAGGHQSTPGVSSTDVAGNGGGASAVVLLGATPMPLVVAGAGGGAAARDEPGSFGTGSGGRGGDSAHPGSPGDDQIVPTVGCTVLHGWGGQPGSQDAAGSGGIGGRTDCTGPGAFNGFKGQDGEWFVAQGAGGNGGSIGGGGGGGGYHGGGGGGAGAVFSHREFGRGGGSGGGGGGSSFVVPGASNMIADGVHTGDGRIEIRVR
ncbi:DUF922 domain-containing protein [Pyxidicoccus sp. MSG2]|uniref:DUF922 domain-containing protein n=1 Tax=Pyxidicoccus sp. MSG2 TaxID=2996790 RepID=UPI00226E8D82|nr:DUF922 domain-containing protein [Pyxidicoccus sp. MSG2]MCY1014516.1 DUF922 domain-containing protein [Pyxidicoccus sp. MSG2]